MIFIIKSKNLNPGPPPAIQPAPSPHPYHHPEEQSHRTPGLCPGTFKEKKGDAPPDLTQTDIPGYQNFFSLVDADYRFLWVDVGSSGSSSDAQIFNRNRFRKKMEDGTLRLLAPEPLWEGGSDCAISGWVITL